MMALKHSNIPVLPLILLALLCGVLVGGHLIPLEVKQHLLSISLLLKSILLLVLPFIIFIYIFSCLTSFEGNVFLFIGLLMAAVCFSNFLSTMIAYGLSQGGLPTIAGDVFAIKGHLDPAWSVSLPSLISNEWALCLGFASGVIFSFYPRPWVIKLSEKGKTAATLFLDKFFIPLIPLFILGFLLKMESEGILWQLVKTYFPILGLLIGFYACYILFLYWIAACYKIQTMFLYIRRMLPAGFTGFSAMSSAAAMPLTIKGAEANTGRPELVKAIIPATVSIHLIGDSIGIPILGIAILLTFGYPIPDFSTFIIFVGYFILAKFAIAAVPGGGIIVMLPVLEKHLGFTPDMLALITALYLLFDPFFTFTNVMGNGAFAVIVSRFFKKGK
jgi:Na+/H+-dicarboxylate symporter